LASSSKFLNPPALLSSSLKFNAFIFALAIAASYHVARKARRYMVY